MNRVAARFTNSEHNGDCKSDVKGAVKGAGLKAAATKSKPLHTFIRSCAADKATTNCFGCGTRVAGVRDEGISAIGAGVVLIFCRFLCCIVRDLARVAEWHTRRT